MDHDADADADADLQRALALSLQQEQPQPQPQTQTHLQHEEGDDEEKQLAQALALSLQNENELPSSNSQSDHNIVVNDSTGTTSEHSKSTPALVPVCPLVEKDVSSMSSSVQSALHSASPTDVQSCHEVLWDSMTTQRMDQDRWLAQGIAFKSILSDSSKEPSSSSSSVAQPPFITNPIPENDHYQKIVADADSSVSVLSAIICHSNVWGLTQAFGGPCGVLASIQAEIMRLLLFGPRTKAVSASTQAASVILPVHLPTKLTNTFCCRKPTQDDKDFLEPNFMNATLCLSLGVILARAAMATTIDANKDTNEKRTTGAVKLVFPNPKNDSYKTLSELDYKHFEPWKENHDPRQGGTKMPASEYLVTYTITNDAASYGDGNGNGTGRGTGDETALAQAVAIFLLETGYWQWYSRKGGVLLFVLALISSRTPTQIRKDMDISPLPTALTAEFGHCSQEILNLLLTGKATSNVFDFELRPSNGDLVCRGIFQRPMIGYLTLLESMRYLEVGSFYKTPKFPIWVVGSESHFTVLFGDASSLQESASDRILKRVRRAFKAQDGAEEQGFIPISKLEDLLKELGLLDDSMDTSTFINSRPSPGPVTTLTSATKLDRNAVHMLAASMEVHGAGILLWEDVWKRVSRLLVGDSLNAVLNMENTTNASRALVTSTTESISAATTAPSPKSETDEELARRLQAEWNGDENTANSTETFRTTAATIPRTTTQSQADHPNPLAEGRTIQLYHYNGLQGGYMKPFRVTTMNTAAAIGDSVSLSDGTTTGAVGGASPQGLQSVLETKWPGCKVNWLRGPPPKID